MRYFWIIYFCMFVGLSGLIDADSTYFSAPGIRLDETFSSDEYRRLLKSGIEKGEVSQFYDESRLDASQF